MMTIVTMVLKLALDGYISAEWGAICLAVLVFFVAGIKTRGSIGRLIRTILRVSLPLASFACFVGFLEIQEPGAGLGVLAVFVVALGFYTMFHGMFPDKRKPR